MTTARRTTTVIGLVLTLIVPLATMYPVVRSFLHIPGVGTDFGREGFWWLLVAVMLLYVTVIERRPLSSIGLRTPDWKSVALGIAGALVIVVGVGALMGFLLPLFHLKQNAEAVQKLTSIPYSMRFLLVLRAGVAEELFFRGYGIERLRELTGSRSIAAVVTLALFTIGHLSFWGWTQVLIAGAAGLVLTLLYLWRRDLVCNMIAHFLTDAVGLLLR
jgi:membrane protease YdiL (CAAX protease family)